VLFAIFIIVGAGNAVNITDGSTASPSFRVMVAARASLISYLSGNAVFADFCNPYVAGHRELRCCAAPCLAPASVPLVTRGRLRFHGRYRLAGARRHESARWRLPPSMRSCSRDRRLVCWKRSRIVRWSPSSSPASASSRWRRSIIISSNSAGTDADRHRFWIVSVVLPWRPFNVEIEVAGV